MRHGVRIPSLLLALVALCIACGGANSASPSADAGTDALIHSDASAVSDSGVAGGPMVNVVPLASVPTTWRVGGVWVFSEALGFAVNDYPAFSTVLNTVLAPQHRYSARDDIIAHASAHDGPYADEVERALAARALPSGPSFFARHFAAPRGLYVLLLLEATPQAPRMRSQDGDDRPAIAAEFFPFQVQPTLLREGEPIPAEVGAQLVAPPSGAAPGAAPTHVFNIFAFSHEDLPEGVGVQGAYSAAGTVTDATGAGYRFEIAFSVRCDDADRGRYPSLCDRNAP